MSEIRVLYTRFNQKLPGNFFNQYLTQLPTGLQGKNLRYHRWQDQHSHLFGKLLLLAGLKNYGYADDILNGIQYNQYSRPFIDGNIDFNISHSGEYVLCAIGKDLRLGVDVEEIKEINFDDYRKVMTPEQWQNILSATNPTRSFFKFWTIKESVIKADSRGLSISLLDIHVKENKVRYDNQTWYLKVLQLDKDYFACLATNKEHVDISLHYVNFFENNKESQLNETLHNPELQLQINN